MIRKEMFVFVVCFAFFCNAKVDLVFAQEDCSLDFKQGQNNEYVAEYLETEEDDYYIAKGYRSVDLLGLNLYLSNDSRTKTKSRKSTSGDLFRPFSFKSKSKRDKVDINVYFPGLMFNSIEFYVTAVKCYRSALYYSLRLFFSEDFQEERDKEFEKFYNPALYETDSFYAIIYDLNRKKKRAEVGVALFSKDYDGVVEMRFRFKNGKDEDYIKEIVSSIEVKEDWEELFFLNDE